MLYVILILWTIVGAITAGAFYIDKTLPAEDLYKNVVAIIACGPLMWIITPIVLGAQKLGRWLKG
ncbi:hypothetical protein LCGC14_0805740 [marine sediment metagenome]|uniref:Uncharacterized protein n=1 Tax=marine sediment metagenome TaxID=412755 RepID=A0A0F9PN81_9ZZZZ